MEHLPRIVIIDDNQLDAQLLREAFTDFGFNPAVVWAQLGLVGLDILKHVDAADGPLLVVLDLNMPAISGQEVLQRIRSDPRLSDVPVLVMTTSAFERDKQLCESLGVSGFIQKPHSFEEYRVVVEKIRDLVGEPARKQIAAAKTLNSGA